MRALAFDIRVGLARDIVRKAIREQLQISTSMDDFWQKNVAEEILATITRPGLSPALQVLSAAVAGDPRKALEADDK